MHVHGVKYECASLPSLSCRGNCFGFWRKPGQMDGPILWPDHDFWGWTFIWIAPHDIIQRQLSSEGLLAWRDRDPRVFWTGAKELGPHRKPFFDCMQTSPDEFYYNGISWGNLRSDSDKPLVFQVGVLTN